MNYRVALPGFSRAKPPKDGKKAGGGKTPKAQRNASAAPGYAEIEDDGDDDAGGLTTVAIDDAAGGGGAAAAGARGGHVEHHEEVRARVARREWASLYDEGDELSSGIREGRVLTGWQARSTTALFSRF